MLSVRDYFNKIRKYVDTTYLLTGGVLLIQYCFFWKEIINTSIIHYAIIGAADIALILLPLLFLKGKWRMSVWIPIIGLNVYWLINILYFRTYLDLMPLSSFALTDNVDDVLIESTLHSLRIQDLVYPLGLVFLAFFYIKYHKSITNTNLPFKAKAIFSASILLWILCSHAYREYDYFQEYKFLRPYKVRTLSKFNLIKASYCESWGEHEGCVSQKRKLYTLGLLPHLLLSSIHELTPTPPITEEELILVRNTVSELNGEIKFSDKNFASNNDKNIILIIVESLNSWVLDMDVDGKPVTPHLREMMSSGDAVIATNLVSQAGPGRSSDGQFIINTGLLPLRNEVTVLRHSDNLYPSLAKAVGNREKFEVICEERSLWRHGITSKSFGYNHIFDSTDATAAGLTTGPTEETMFHLAEKIINKTKQPFFCTLITLAMHGPYKYEPKWKTWIFDSSLPTDLKLYLEATHFFDTQLGEFITYLKTKGLYDNSIIIITADHESNVPGYKGDGIGMVPFIAVNAGVDTIISRRGGQIDVFPTILDVTNRNNYEWKGLGKSLLSPQTVDGALSPDGKVIGNMSDEQIRDYQKRWNVSELIIKHNLFKEENLMKGKATKAQSQKH